MKKNRLIALATIMSIFCGCSSEKPPQKEEIEIPAQYNLMDYGRATEIASQGNTGTCWAYSALNAAESNLIISGLAQSDINLSEGHLAYYMYDYLENPDDSPTEDGIYIFVSKRKNNYYKYFAGSEAKFTIGKLSNGMGPIPESEAPFQNKNVKEAEASDNAIFTAEQEGKIQKYMGDYLLKDANYYNTSDATTLKNAIIEKGAMEFPIYVDSKYHFNKECAYYCPDVVDDEPNHAVSLIGWDDTYSKENFGIYKPKNDGAWLALDSSTPGYSDAYLWISYEDANLAEAISYEFCERSSYGDILYYDDLGCSDSIVTKEEYTTIANTFHITDIKEIKAVGIYTLDPSRKVEINIYTGGTEGVPDSGNCQTQFSVTPEQKGYHVIDLEKTIPVQANESCSVVVKYYNDDGLGKAPVEGANKQYDDNPFFDMTVYEIYVSEKGQSYALSNGEWYDLSEESSAEVFGKTDIINNACIKLLLK